jgi:hypothetical protein
MTRVKQVCEDCGTDDVCREGDVIWSIQIQTWVLDPNSDAEGYCRRCCAQVIIDEAPV